MSRLSLIVKALRTGVVTEPYPFKPAEAPEGFRGRPVIDPDKCTGCGACVSVCPPNAISMSDEGEYRVVRIFYGRCTFCAMCRDSCPSEAITMTREFELATDSLDDLYYEVHLKLAECRVCGRRFTTVTQLERLARELEGRGVPFRLEDLYVCPDCRGRGFARVSVFGR